MKKIIFFLLVLTGAIQSFASLPADTIPSQQPTNAELKQELLGKSKNQRTAAWILTGGGAGVTVLGFSIAKQGKILSSDTNKTSDFGLGLILIVAGLIVTTAGLITFSKASTTKKKAMSLSFKNESIPHLEKNNFVYKTIPSLSLKISL